MADKTFQLKKSTQGTTAAVDPSDTIGKNSNKAVLKQLFAGSPLYDELAPDNLKAYCAQFFKGAVDDKGYGSLGEVERNFAANSPNLLEGTFGGAGGQPASPYVPNPSSPGDGSIEATNMPKPPENYGMEPKSETWGNGSGHKSPSETSPGLASVWDGALPVGSSSHNG